MSYEAREPIVENYKYSSLSQRAILPLDFKPQNTDITGNIY